ncbi:MAG: hypothetical protein HQK83_18595 [Fibrobacteria bacterium]|nr:hypothetical protein [Fibrobacteria bacterium]
MNIKFFLSESESKKSKIGEQEKALSDIIDSYAKKIGFSTEYIEDIVVTDEEHYNQALETYTKANNAPAKGIAEFARTCFHEPEKNVFRSSIVFRTELVESVLAIGKKKSEDLSVDEMSFKYLVYHELGHCLDNKNRKNLACKESEQINKFNINELFEHYSELLLSELAASFFSARAMSPELYQQNMLSVVNGIAGRFKKLDKIKEDYTDKPAHLFKMAMASSSAFWVILVHYSNLIGSRLNNEELSGIQLEVWPEASKISHSLILEFEKMVCLLWNKYPDWQTEDYNFLVNIWKFLGMENGYKFVQNPEGDGVYW